MQVENLVKVKNLINKLLLTSSSSHLITRFVIFWNMKNENIYWFKACNSDVLKFSHDPVSFVIRAKQITF